MTEEDPTGGFGFKRLTVENWQTPDPIWQFFAHPIGEPARTWVQDVISHDLMPTVPLAVRRLFEVARGSLVYGWFFYPLLTVGTEQLFRVLEAAISHKCDVLNSPKKSKTFDEKVKWLHKVGQFSNTQHYRWDNARQLRNHTSHPKDQMIFDPNGAMEVLCMSVTLIDDLFRQN